MFPDCVLIVEGHLQPNMEELCSAHYPEEVKYIKHGKNDGSLTLMGVFEVSLSGNHVDRYFGCYWWD